MDLHCKRLLKIFFWWFLCISGCASFRVVEKGGQSGRPPRTPNSRGPQIVVMYQDEKGPAYLDHPWCTTSPKRSPTSWPWHHYKEDKLLDSICMCQERWISEICLVDWWHDATTSVQGDMVKSSKFTSWWRMFSWSLLFRTWLTHFVIWKLMFAWLHFT